LFQAIFEHWNSTIEERVNALRAVPLNADDPNTLPAIIEAFIGPVLLSTSIVGGIRAALPAVTSSTPSSNKRRLKP
jgi:hypothetical protein